MRQQMEMIEATCVKDNEVFKTMSDKIERLELEAKKYETLIKSKDKYLDEKDAEIEKLQTIISNMDDGEGVVDFVNDFIKKDEDLVNGVLNKLKDEEKTVDDYRISCAQMAHTLSRSIMRSLEIEIEETPLPKIRKIQGRSQMEETYFTTQISVDAVVKTINNWRGAAGCHGSRQDAILVMRNTRIYKQNDDGTVRKFQRGRVMIYSDKDVTETDIVENPSLYINAFLKITKPDTPTKKYGTHDTIKDRWGNAFDYETKIVVQEDFEPIEDEGTGQLIMGIGDIWYQTTDPTVRIIKKYRNGERAIFLKPEIRLGPAPHQKFIRFNWVKDW
tara:strand:+ start:573 stop:1565 length:993 start_codon:yes stop_codon:yes gene_type:complete